MSDAPWGLIIIAIALLIIYTFNNLSSFNLSNLKVYETVTLYGIRINASLDEIFNLLKKPGRIEPIAILNSSHKHVWTPEKQMELSDNYFVIQEYAIIMAKPPTINIESIYGLQNTTRDMLTPIFKRPNVFLSFTDAHGKTISEPRLVAFRMVFIICIVFSILAGILTIRHFMITKGQSIITVYRR